MEKILYLVEEALVNRVFNSFDLPFVHCCREVGAVQFSTQEHLVLRLEVFIVDMRWRMAIQKLPLCGATTGNCNPLKKPQTTSTSTGGFLSIKTTHSNHEPSILYDLHWRNPSGCSELIWTDRAGREMSWSLSCLQQERNTSVYIQ